MASGIARTADWQRIDTLPIRSRSHHEIAAWGSKIERAFRVPGSNAELLPAQVDALVDWGENGGYCGWLAVGSGKTLVSLLAPNFFPHRCALLLVDANLKPKTLEAMRFWGQHFRLSPSIVVQSYSAFQVKSGATLFENIAPEIIIADEAIALRNPRSARTRRFLRYVGARPDVKVMLLDGSILEKSIMDYWHLSTVALRAKSPLPLNPTEARRWADSIDVGVDERSRPLAGVLREWAPAHARGYPDVVVAREGFRSRAACTPGYAIGGDTVLANDLVLRERTPPPVDVKVAAALTRLEAAWETPNGEIIVSALDMRRHQRELLTGFWQRWDPPAPLDWLEKRREYGKLVRRVLSQDIPGLDSPLQVANKYAKDPRVVAWREIKPSFIPNPVPTWESDWLIEDIAKWMDEHNGIVWVSHIPLGRRLAEKTGRRYFGAGADDAREILTAPGPFVASVESHHKGKDLQQHHRSLVVTPSASGRRWEQLLGRTDRQGQQAGVVTYDVYLHHACHVRCMKEALDRALFLEQTTAPQRLLRAQKQLFSLTEAD